MTENSTSSNAEQLVPGTERSRWPVVRALTLVLLLLAGAIFGAQLHLRRHLFTQIAARDGETLEQVAAVQFAADQANDPSTSLQDPSEQVQLALKISHRLRSVLGVRLFTPEGDFVTAVPAYITEAELPGQDLAQLKELRPVSHFIPQARLQEQDVLAETNSEAIPLLVVTIPLREEGSNQLAGMAQFLMHGAAMAAEYRELKQHLAIHGAIVFLGAGALITTVLVLAFQSVRRTNRLLAERTNSLLRANRELALAAKTSAIGAVTSHLIHGLKNPLSGLRSFVQERADEGNVPGTDWEMAALTTQRMQTLVDRVVRVLQEQQTAVEYELSLAELLQMLQARLAHAATHAGVRLRVESQGEGAISNREADLLLLILENLAQNAIEATPAGRQVFIRIEREGEQLTMEVQDEGPGLSPAVAERLFTPCSSGKKGGTGIGLAISRQLAVHLGASLELKSTSNAGCCFRLVMPLRTEQAANSTSVPSPSTAQLG